MNTDRDIFAVVLGEMQDAGLPHIGCRCPNCSSGRVGYAACLAVVDTRGANTNVTLIDATPDIKHQLELLADYLRPHGERPYRFNPPDAIFLTHAHLGHIGGLPQFGPEAMAVSGLPVYASAELAALLQETRLWSPMVANLDIRPFTPHQSIPLAPNLTITPIPVPHRDELQVGTFAFKLQGPQQTLLYLPDIDDWQAWPEAKSVLAGVDTAVVDASFYSLDELNGRPPVAHPLIMDTLAFFADWPGQLVLTHFNHTNPVLVKGSEAETAVSQTGTQLAYPGKLIPL
ncbi:MAG: MBL fold metallo-hydrolase [Ardenticatenaceae bacterium]|nr:MBL fold metallo-hydrolase [Ardenticatenaceae bacterium]